MLDPTYRKADRDGERLKVRAESAATHAVTDAWLAVARIGERVQVQEQARGWLGEGDDACEALQALQAHIQPDVQLLCCGTCCFFQVTGMSRQMGGSAGYCLVYFPTHGRSLDDVVSTFDFCDRYVHCPGGGGDSARMRLWEAGGAPGATHGEASDAQ